MFTEGHKLEHTNRLIRVVRYTGLATCASIVLAMGFTTVATLRIYSNPSSRQHYLVIGGGSIAVAKGPRITQGEGIRLKVTGPIAFLWWPVSARDSFVDWSVIIPLWMLLLGCASPTVWSLWRNRRYPRATVPAAATT